MTDIKLAELALVHGNAKGATLYCEGQVVGVVDAIAYQQDFAVVTLRVWPEQIKSGPQS